MATLKPSVKFAFCLTSKKLKGDFNAFELLKIIKDKSKTSYNYEILSTDLLESYAKFLPIEVRLALDNFSTENLKFQASLHSKFFKKQKSGTAIDEYIQKAMLKNLHAYFEQLINVQDTISIYHKIINPKTNNLTTTPCRFSTAVPKLSFEAIKQTNGSLSLRSLVTIDNIIYDLLACNVNGILLEIDNVYYLLSATDTQTLNNLRKTDIAKFGKSESAFMQYVISPLEPRYIVNKEHIFKRKIIDTQPTNCIYLSEINSGSFLMLTPQWKYDGVLMEGTYKAEYDTTINGELYCIKRNSEVENNFSQFIKALHPNFTKQLNGYYYLPFDEAKKKNWFLKTYHTLLEQNVELIGMDMLSHFRYSPYQINTQITNVKTTDYLIEADINISFGDEIVNPIELQKTLFNHQKSILLSDNSIGVLDEEWMANYSSIIMHGKFDKNKITIPQWLLVTASEISALYSLKFVINTDWWQKWSAWQDVASTVYPVPALVQATLRPYQQKGYEWMRLLSEIRAGSCLADDMGLGKTLQTICFLAAQYEADAKSKFIIVCPGSLIYNWQQELQKFCPALSTFIYYGNNRKIDDFMQQNATVLITAYSTLRADIDKLKNVFWNTIVLDESHNIKSLYAQTTKAVYQIIAKNKIALSGTPIINNTFDLFAQINYLLPGYLGTQELFKKEYVLPIDRDKNKDKIEVLQRITNPFILRRTKAQVATDLPPKTELILWCEMDEQQQEVYDKIKNNIRKSIFLNIKNEGLNKSKLSVLQGIIKLRQVCGAPQLLKDDSVTCKASVKIETLVDELQNNLSNNKVLVFSQFKEMLNLLGAALQQANIPYFHFDGDTKVEDRMSLVAQFQHEENTTNVFLMSLKTGNAGITLTAADYVFLVDPWWNSAIEQQAIDRTHRIGQTKNVFAYKMICKNTIEEKIIEIQKRKQFTSDALISEEENFVKNLTQEDITYLFE